MYNNKISAEKWRLINYWQALFVVSVWMAKPVFVVSVLMAKSVFVVCMGLRVFQKI